MVTTALSPHPYRDHDVSSPSIPTNTRSSSSLSLLIDALPNDILVHILTFLDNRDLLLKVSPSCRALHDASRRAIRHLSLIGDSHPTTGFELPHLLHRHCSLQSLEVHFSHLFNYGHWSDILFGQAVARDLPLEKLTITNCRNLNKIGAIQRGIESPLKHRIKRLEVLHCRNLCEVGTWDSVLVRLEHVDLSGCPLPSSFIEDIIESNPNLRVFKASHNSQIRSIGIRSRLLETLVFSRCTELNKVSLNCPNLCELDLSRTGLDDDELTRIFPQDPGDDIQSLVPQLHTLHLDGCRKLVKPHIFHKKLSKLTMRRLTNMTHPVIECPSLKSLDMGGALRLMDDALEDAIMGCSALEELLLSKCSALKSVSIPKSVSTALTRLDLTLSRQVHSVTFATPTIIEKDTQTGTLVASLSPPAMQDLTLDWTSITDKSLSTIVQQCSKLHRLSLHGVDSLKNPRIHVASPTLSSIIFSGCHNLERPIIRSPKRHQVKLVLDMCRSLQDPVIEYMDNDESKAVECWASIFGQSHRAYHQQRPPVRRRLVF